MALPKITIWLLVCLKGTPGAQCTVDTAQQVIKGPEVTSEVTCAMHGQAFAGSLAFYDVESSYLKIMCAREKGDRS